ncbi:hypothetical protein DICVIV_05013 [Dictyocaulus viviparus]|uniref:Uncharacterized protein n=1 Tax=Dictyocaulus viviparus TaxID=29172 RepID=A0A0D8XYG6_DICVI|nr:hypothetical protein DICVIV_05013 [Dictyocaulus viviparus]
MTIHFYSMTVQIGRLLVSFSIITLATTANLHCDNNLFCSRIPHSSWLARRDAALRLVEIQKLTKGQGFISMNSSLFHTFEYKDSLCSDELYTGFLLEENARNWNVSCLWTGTSISVTCAPVPPIYSSVPFTYLPPSEWQQRVKIAELFICNERCIQAGIGYLPSLIMLLSFSIAFIKNCLM